MIPSKTSGMASRFNCSTQSNSPRDALSSSSSHGGEMAIAGMVGCPSADEGTSSCGSVFSVCTTSAVRSSDSGSTSSSLVERFVEPIASTPSSFGVCIKIAPAAPMPIRTSTLSTETIQPVFFADGRDLTKTSSHSSSSSILPSSSSIAKTSIC